MRFLPRLIVLVLLVEMFGVVSQAASEEPSGSVLNISTFRNYAARKLAARFGLNKSDLQKSARVLVHDYVLLIPPTFAEEITAVSFISPLPTSHQPGIKEIKYIGFTLTLNGGKFASFFTRSSLGPLDRVAGFGLVASYKEQIDEAVQKRIFARLKRKYPNLILTRIQSVSVLVVKATKGLKQLRSLVADMKETGTFHSLLPDSAVYADGISGSITDLTAMTGVVDLSPYLSLRQLLEDDGSLFVHHRAFPPPFGNGPRFNMEVCGVHNLFPQCQISDLSP